MQAVRFVKNQYRGINAHLHSYWQAEGGWNSFHATYIDDLMKEMKARLRPMGYTAVLAKSLQTRRDDEADSRPESDVTIFDSDPVRSIYPSTTRSGTASMVLSVAQALRLGAVTQRQYSAVAIYEVAPGQKVPGEPVAWVELLSPSNKPGGADEDEYWRKRLKILQSAVVFVEIDYLHESSPTLDHVPNYRTRSGRSGEPDSHPYRIVVIDPRPVFETGPVYMNHFDVDEVIPDVDIPLNGNHQLRFPFGVAYTKSFNEAFLGDDVDYTQLPLNFDRYSPADQQRIANRMLAVLKAAKEGKDLESSAPLPVEDLPLELALEHLHELTLT